MYKRTEKFSQTKDASQAIVGEFKLSKPQLDVLSGRAKRLLAKMIEDAHGLPGANPDKKKVVLSELKDVVRWALEDAVRVDSQGMQGENIGVVNANHLAQVLSRPLHKVHEETQQIITSFVQAAHAATDFEG